MACGILYLPIRTCKGSAHELLGRVLCAQVCIDECVYAKRVELRQRDKSLSINSDSDLSDLL